MGQRLLPPREITVEIRDGDRVSARRADGKASGDQPLRLDGIDEQLVRVFTRWMATRHRQWQREDVAAFGSLLFRVLLDGRVWDLIAVTLDELLDGQALRLVLSFRGSASQRLASLPWEYLYRPDLPARPGRFLATDEHVLVSRSVAGESRGPGAERSGPLRVLAVVAQPVDEADVVAEPVLSVLDRLADAGSVELRRCASATTGALTDALAGQAPDVLHVVGHGRHDEQTGSGRIAFVDLEGLADWVAGEQLSEILRSGAPRLVLLQSCSAGKEDPSLSFAGVAPQMVRHGAPSVVAMQYDVTPDVATAFARSFYEGLLDTGLIDAATQRARRFLAGPTSSYRDPRLIGLPVVYACHGSAALGSLAGPHPVGSADHDR